MSQLKLNGDTITFTDGSTQNTAPKVGSVAGKTGDIVLAKEDVGLDNVDNTSDINKPVSTAQALADTAVQNAAATDATTKANAAQAYAIQRGNHTGTQAIGTIDGLQAALDSKQTGGSYATLVNGTVPASQLPSYVDDVLEYADLASFPESGETGKIYVTLDSNKTYRWSGSSYIEIASSPGSTDAVPEGSVNLYYTDARASAAAPVQSVAGQTGIVTLSKNDVGLNNVDNTSDTDKPVSNATQMALDLKAPIDNPTFTGTVGGITKDMVGLGNVDNTNDASKPISNATQTALDLKAPVNNPTFTGNVSGVTKDMVGLSNVDNTSDMDKPVSNATQTALDAKAPTDNPTFTGTVGGISKGMVGLGNVDNTSDINKPVSIAQQAELDLKAPINNPTFTGVVGGISKGMVGLNDVDNTSDMDKPVSTATQLALDAKAPIDNPIFTGTVGGITKNMVGLNNVDNTSDINKPVSTATQLALDEKAPINNPTFTGTVGGIAKSMVGLGNVDNTSDMDKPVGTATQLVLDAKAPINNPTFTGTVGGLTKNMVGLGNVDNTSDMDKPVSTAQANADNAVQSAAADDATSKADVAKAYAIQRANHTGYQAISTVSGLQAALDSKQQSGSYATLVNGTVPASQLPSTDSVAEGNTNLYYTNARASAAAPVQSVAGRSGDVTLTKSDVGLSSVDNTSDINKPVSTAQAAANVAVQSAAASDATTKANAAQAYAIQRANHTGTQAINTVDGLQTALDSKLSASDLNTDIVAGGGVGLNYNNVNGTLTVYSTNEVYVTSLGSVSGTVAVNYDPLSRSIQTLTLTGTTTTFTKGSGWPTLSGTSVDVVLKITVSSATTIVWTIVNEWYNQPTAGALSIGTHLFLLRAVGNSVIEGHYIGIKTN